MAEIRADGRSVAFLLGQKYQIDYYQRDYLWERKQIRELIDDLTTKFLQYHEKTHKRKEVSQYGQYFLGSIIVSKKGVGRFIVDGQQRLTSLTLLLIYLDRLQNNAADDQRVEISNLIYSTRYGSKSFNLDVTERSSCLQDLVDGQQPNPNNRSPSVQNLMRRFNDIADIFPDELRGDALPYFIDWLTEKVMLVEITAYSDDDAYAIFETMNDRGLSLTPTDMLKGYLLSNIEDDGSRSDAQAAWKKRMAALKDLGKDEDADCIKAWLRSQYADTIRDRKAGAEPEDFDKMGTEFHRWVRENSARIDLGSSDDFAKFVTDHLAFYARAYAKARDAAENYKKELTSIYFNAQNSFTLQYPLMLSPLRLSDSEDNITNKMRMVSTFIEIMLARRIWNSKAIGHSAMQYWAFLAMKDIRSMDLDELRDALIFRLQPGGATRDDYIDFETAEPFRLHRTNGPQVHRLLARLTEFLEVQSDGTPRYPEYANRSSRKGGYQIEHIWADHPERHKDDFAQSQDFRAYRDRIGGLVLLPAGDNASYADMTYAEKVKHYSKQNLLASSLNPSAYENKPGFKRFLEETHLPFREMPSFNKVDLDERQELYIALANLCWSPDHLKKI